MNSSSMASPETWPAAGLWRRFFARVLDLLLLGIPVGIAVFIMLFALTAMDRILPGASCPSNFLLDLEPGWFEGVLGVIVSLLVMFADAAMQAKLGGTPGKALLGVVVRRADNKPMDYGFALSRNLRMWAFGMGANIPMLNLIAMTLSWWRLKQGRSTVWDERLDCRVFAKPLSVGRVAGYTITLICLLIVFQMGRMVLFGQFKPAQEDSLKWTNPVTGKSVNAAGWRLLEPRNETNRWGFGYFHSSGRPRVRFAKEDVGPYTLLEQIERLKQGDASLANTALSSFAEEHVSGLVLKGRYSGWNGQYVVVLHVFSPDGRVMWRTSVRYPVCAIRSREVATDFAALLRRTVF